MAVQWHGEGSNNSSESSDIQSYHSDNAMDFGSDEHGEISAIDSEIEVDEGCENMIGMIKQVHGKPRSKVGNIMNKITCASTPTKHQNIEVWCTYVLGEISRQLLGIYNVYVL